MALTTVGQGAPYQHGTDFLSVASISVSLEKLKQAPPEDIGDTNYVLLSEEEVYDFIKKQQSKNYQEVTTNEEHFQEHHPSHYPSEF